MMTSTAKAAETHGAAERCEHCGTVLSEPETIVFEDSAMTGRWLVIACPTCNAFEIIDADSAGLLALATLDERGLIHRTSSNPFARWRRVPQTPLVRETGYPIEDAFPVAWTR